MEHGNREPVSEDADDSSVCQRSCRNFRCEVLKVVKKSAVVLEFAVATFRENASPSSSVVKW